MRRRALFAVMLLAPMLAGCADDFDLDKLDIFNVNKEKKLPGERKELFPGGVPGVTQGIPPDLVKGYKPPETAAVPVEPEPEKPKAKPAPKPRVVHRAPKPAPAQQAAKPAPKPAAQPAAQQAQQQPAPAWPDPKPQGQQSWPAPPQQPSAWPAPPAPNTFQR